MTSLDFFPPADHTPREPLVWGTGKLGWEKSNMWTPKAPTWQYSGDNTDPTYTLTSLKLSNNRLNDQLLPNPQHEYVGQVLSDVPFPAEHPYSSHISRTAMFPKFISPDDPQTGTEARKHMPKNATTPANAYDVKILHKTKGSGLRHEIQALPSESEKKPLHWHDHDFDQFLKYPGANKQDYYPIPPTIFNPNSEGRNDGNCIRGNMTVSPRTADTMRNLERDQWTTHYDRNYTGLGPSNPHQLDNYHEKLGHDDSLKPTATRTFNPARPVEGRISRSLVPPPPPQTGEFPEHPKDPSYTRKLTSSEKAEDLLLNGKEYVNLPDTPRGGLTEPHWRGIDMTAHPASGLQNLAHSQALGESAALPYTSIESAQTPTDLSHVDDLLAQRHDSIQQMEASNRWQVLEGQQPHQNTLARQRKMELVSSEEQPAVFYSHEGTFQRERSGLYKTTYDPYALQTSMNKDEKTGARLMDFSDYHTNALDLPTALNGEMAEAIRYNRTLGTPGSVPQLNDQPSQYEAIGPFDKAKSMQKAQLQPNAQRADVRTQEGHLVLTESTQGESYNTKKFLQENKLPLHARNEPLQLMSKENQNLNKVRLTTIPTPTAGRPMRVPDDILTGDPLPGGNWLSKSCDFEGMRPTSSPELGMRYSYSSSNVMKGTGSGGVQSLPVPLGMSKIQSRYTTADQFLSKSTNFLPNTKGSWFANQSQCPQSYKPMTDLTYKNGDKFQWTPGCGTTRPQSSLLDIQNSFSKSDVRKQFHERFPENGVDLRENIIFGKKHNFNGVNAQILRGTPIVD